MSDKGGSDGASGMPPSYSGPIPEHQTPAYRAAKLAVIILSILIVLAVIAGIAMPNADPDFVETLATIVRRELAAVAA